MATVLSNKKQPARVALGSIRIQKARHFIDNYVPLDLDAVSWATVGPVLRDLMLRAGFESGGAVPKHCTTLRHYLAWRVSQGLSLDVDELTRAEAIDDFYSRGMTQIGDHTRNDYRSRLLSLARRISPDNCTLVPTAGYNSSDPETTSTALYTLAIARLVRTDAAATLPVPRREDGRCRDTSDRESFEPGDLEGFVVVGIVNRINRARDGNDGGRGHCRRSRRLAARHCRGNARLHRCRCWHHGAHEPSRSQMWSR